MGVLLVQQIQFFWMQRQNSTWRCTLREGKWARVISGENLSKRQWHLVGMPSVHYEQHFLLKVSGSDKRKLSRLIRFSPSSECQFEYGRWWPSDQYTPESRPSSMLRYHFAWSLQVFYFLSKASGIWKRFFRTPAPRPVQLPLGLLVRFVVGILTCSSESQVS